MGLVDMAAPGQPGYSGYPGTRSPWFIFRFLCFLSFLCFAIAAFIAGGVIHGPEWAWGFGGFAAYALAWAVP
jgi:hypothetical protein